VDKSLQTTKYNRHKNTQSFFNNPIFNLSLYDPLQVFMKIHRLNELRLKW